MDQIDPSVECGGLSEKYEFRPRSELLMHPFYSFEKHQLHLAATIFDPYAHSLYRVEFQIFAIFVLLLGSDAGGRG